MLLNPTIFFKGYIHENCLSTDALNTGKMFEGKQNK